MNKTQKRALQLLRKRTRFTNAGIGRPGLWGIDSQAKGFLAAFRFASRLYRRSWIEPILDVLESEESAEKLRLIAGSGEALGSTEPPLTREEFGAMAEHILKPTVPTCLEFRDHEIAGIDLDNLVLNLALRGLKLERLDHADAPGYAIRITRAD